MSINKLERLKYLRILEENGSYYGDIPLAIDAHNVSMQNKFNLQSTIGDIDYSTEDDITTNLRNIKGNIERIGEDLKGKANTEQIREINNLIQKLNDEIDGKDIDIDDLGLYQDYTTGNVYLTYKGQIGGNGIPLAILKGQINQNVDDYVDKEIEKIDKELPITVYIDSSAGNIFKRGDVNTILTAQVYKGSKNITDTINSFTWKKYDQYGILEEGWTKRNYGNMITITPQDIIGKAKIVCEIEN